MNMFEQATRTKLRFTTPKGSLGVEDLWDLPLTSNSGKANLNDIGKAIRRQLSANGEDLVLDEGKATDETAQLAFDVVKRIIDIKVDERKKASEVAVRKEKRQQIMAIIEDRQNQDLKGLPMEELKKLLAET